MTGVVVIQVANPVCEGQVIDVTGSGGIIQSPDYGSGSYPENARCRWRINAGPGKVIIGLLDSYRRLIHRRLIALIVVAVIVGVIISVAAIIVITVIVVIAVIATIMVFSLVFLISCA